MNKILQQFRILLVPCLFIFNYTITVAQNKYGVIVIDNKDSYKRSIAQDSLKKMIELRSLIPDIAYDLRYATSNNFMRRRMYSGNIRHTFLRKPAAEALAKVQQELKAKGFGLKIFDAYRPYSVTVKFWELVKDEKYVANPAKGSAHNRGLAVDVTLIDLKTKNEIEMGTGFDNFTDTAHHSFTNLDNDVKQNRKLLRDIMKKNGFDMFDTEWWHYSWPNTNEYEILDLKL
ncbi:MAG: M15 family metallopeptidase [Chitinophagaceae bacterium]|nr:M15 family metallopeptidase [Chitinophagaceae bacterium]